MSPLQARDLINVEYEQVKEISDTLASFKSASSRPSYQAPDQDFGSPFGGDYYSKHEEPTRDPDVWPPPTPAEYK